MINPNKNYSLTYIAKNNLLGVKSYFVCKNIILDELWLDINDRILNAEKVGEGRGASYFIKGKNIIKYNLKNNRAYADYGTYINGKATKFLNKVSKIYNKL